MLELELLRLTGLDLPFRSSRICDDALAQGSLAQKLLKMMEMARQAKSAVVPIQVMSSTRLLQGGGFNIGSRMLR